MRNDRPGWDRPEKRRVGSNARSRARQAAIRPLLDGLEARTYLSNMPMPGEVFLTAPSQNQPLEIALDYLSTNGVRLGVSGQDVERLAVTNQYTSTTSKTTYIYLRQKYNGLEVVNANLNLAVTKNGQLVTAGGHFSHLIGQLPETGVPAPAITPAQALASASAILGLGLTDDLTVTRQPQGVRSEGALSAPSLSRKEIPYHLEYVADAQGLPRLAWALTVDMKNGKNWFDMSVDAETGEVTRLHDWVANASYNVFAQPKESPLDGPRTIEVDPHTNAPNASPFGWHDTDGAAGPEFTDTRGNNVNAQEDRDANNTGGHRPDAGSTLVFDYPFDDTRSADTYEDAAITNLFYWNNVLHDSLYQYGFDEVSGNFQFNNYGKGGVGGDPVEADAQDGTGTDNANFGTPPDGQSGRMQMFLWTTTTPGRDGDVENGIIAHEFGHGVSNRLTGGPSNAGALQNIQSRSMGEGWSDFIALWITQNENDQPNDSYSLGAYVLPPPTYPNGVRRFPYSFNTSIYPLSFGDTGGAIPHNNGEIWASALWDLNWLLIEEQGYDPDIYKGVDLDDFQNAAGNHLAMLLVLEGMKLQPANPSFLQARDAILQADQTLFDGAYAPQIWAAFARRGMGFSAQDNGNSNEWNVVEAFDVPNFVQVTAETITFAREDSPLTNVVVGRLTDRSGLGAPDQYNVTVDWGDGRGPLPATLQAENSRTYRILSSASFPEGGNFTLTIRADRQGSIPTTASTPLNVASEPLFVTPGLPISGQEGADESTYVIATFQDLDPGTNPASHYRALIDWGDGFQTFGTIQAIASPDPALRNSFEILGSHGFVEGGRFPVSVTVTEGGGNSASGSVQADISSFPITATGGFLFNVREGSPFSGVVARFVDQDPDLNNVASNYSALITWGDGSTSAGTINRIGANQFEVRGDHAFSKGANGDSNIPVSVLVTEKGGQRATATSAAVVSDAPIAASGVVINAVEGPFSGVVGVFADLNPNGRADEFGATIDFGDGSAPVSGTIRKTGTGTFEIVADHVFRFGVYPVAIEVFTLAAGGNRSSAASQAIVTDAPIVPRGVPVVTIEGVPAANVRVASFTDGNPDGVASEFSALIDWGNGVTTAGTILREGSFFSVVGTNTYGFGTYPINVVILSSSGTRYTTRSTATISDAPLRSDGVPIEATERLDSLRVLGALFDANPFGTAAELAVSVNWGDGTVSPGRLQPGPGGGFVVLADHTYDRSGTFPVVATITSSGGSQSVLTTTARVGVLTVPVSGGLASGSDSGNSSTDGITANAAPVFSGVAAPGAKVRLTARGPQGTIVELGEVVANPSNGSWALATGALADGAYTVLASSTNLSGVQNSPTQVLNGGAPIVVDTATPRVSDVFLDPRRGQVRVRLADVGGGLDDSTLADPAAYKFTDLNGRAVGVRRVEVLSPSGDGSRTVVLSVGNGRALRPGGYVVGVDGTKVRDVAGNGLTEDFFTPFPQLGRQPTTDFLAQIGTNGNGSTAPLQHVPPSALRGAAAFRRFRAAGFRTRPLV